MLTLTTRDASCTMPMTPMIDVVCLLLIFFLVVFNPQDLMSGITTSQSSEQERGPYPVAIRIGVSSTGYTIQGMSCGLDQIDARLAHIAGYSGAIPVQIKCTSGSTHSQLVRVLDVCAKNEMHTLSISSP